MENDFHVLMNMELHEVVEIDSHYIVRVVGGWIYTDRRADNAPSGLFIPIASDQTLKSGNRIEPK